MYITRTPELKYQAAVLAEAIPLIDNLKGWTIKGLAASRGVSEKQVHRWKALLREEGLRLFSTLKPGRRKTDISACRESEQLLIYETINRLLAENRGKYKFTAEDKQRLLCERERLKAENRLTYEVFSQLIGIDSGILRLWARQVKAEGAEGLVEKSRAPKRSPNKLPVEVIRAIERYGGWWYRRHRGLRITEFSVHFRYRHRRLLRRVGKSTLSDKVICRYLKQAGLYKQREEKPKGQRGRFRYYFPGAQCMIDTSAVVFLGVKLKLIAALEAFSRNILHQEVFSGENAGAVIRVLNSSLQAAGRKGLKILSVLSDHGRPYKSGKVRCYLRENGICRNLAAPYWPTGKAAVERYFRTAKKHLFSRCGLIRLFFRGLWVRLVKAVFNLLLLGLTETHNRRDSRQEKTAVRVSPQFQESVRRVLQAEERNSELKSELIDRLYREFFSAGGVKKAQVKGYLSRYRKQDITEGAVVLRRKLVVADLPAINRWLYLSKVVDNIEKRTQEAQVARDRQIIRTQQMNLRQEEEIARVEEEHRWNKRHPEGALEKAVGWYLLLCRFPVARGYYQSEIIKITERIMARHSVLTAGLKMKKLCERIKGTVPLTDALKDNTEPLPTASEVEAAKEEIITLLKRHNFREKQDIPGAQNLRRLWIK